MQVGIPLSKDAIVEPPKTSGFPVIGSVPNVLSKQADYLLDAWQTHGDIYTLDLGAISIVMLNHPDYAQYVLRDNFRNYVKGGEMWDSIRKLVGDGLVSSEGDLWRRQRHMMQPQFHRQHLAGLTNLMVEAIEDGMKDWDAIAESGEAFNVAQAFNKITMKVIVRTMFGGNISDAETDRIGHELGFAIPYMLQDMITGKLPEWLPVPGRKRYHAALDYIDTFVYRMIEERRNEPDHDNGDLFTMMLNLVDAETNEQMTDKQLRDEAVTIFAAGYETTSVAMTWAAHMLSQHLEVAVRLASSVDEALGDRLPKFEDLMQLGYSRQVMEETMRLYPPAFWFTRSAVEDDVIGGYHIKAGQLMAVVPYAIHRHPNFWDKPEHFEPDRFHSENDNHRHPLAFIPFGAGQRQCIGKDFALMEGALILARIAQRYTFIDVPERQPVGAFGPTLSTKDGMWLKIQKR